MTSHKNNLYKRGLIKMIQFDYSKMTSIIPNWIYIEHNSNLKSISTLVPNKPHKGRSHGKR